MQNGAISGSSAWGNPLERGQILAIIMRRKLMAPPLNRT
ncbi:hypothetical protein APY04_2915 [Hyphomicrobium sulfonivorans]|uniref:Uncharacterized protein n=1 Tax=Hyphomicrobium sulfonivorans TaxID=121290 RepID=A0A109BAH9_HYPSL|nr:hypothetical protein APY04_2915 [Hyphomicrobium sulfonivorans]